MYVPKKMADRDGTKRLFHGNGKYSQNTPFMAQLQVDCEKKKNRVGIINLAVLCLTSYLRT